MVKERKTPFPDTTRSLPKIESHQLVHEFSFCRTLKFKLAELNNESAEMPLRMIQYQFDRNPHAPALRLSQIMGMKSEFEHFIFDNDLAIYNAKRGYMLEGIDSFFDYVRRWNKHPKANEDGYHRHGTIAGELKKGEQYSDATVELKLQIHDKLFAFVVNEYEGLSASVARDCVHKLYLGYWQTMIFETAQWSKVYEAASFFCKVLSHRKPLFDLALSAHHLGKSKVAISAYRELLVIAPDSFSAMHNLSLLVEDSDFSESFALSQKAAELQPDDKQICERRDSLQSKKAELDRETNQREAFLATARERWPKLDYNKKKILSTLALAGKIDYLERLAELSGVAERYIEGHWNKLVELGMIDHDDDGNARVNPHILDLVKRERSHAVATTIIRADSSINFKPIFNSRQEYTIYKIILGLFPNQLVFPNMALQSIFQYKRMKPLVDSDTFRYYLMSHVDVCVTSTTNYFPILAFEIDSPYHDLEDQIKRDEKKNQLFKLGGVPLLRLPASVLPRKWTRQSNDWTTLLQTCSRKSPRIGFGSTESRWSLCSNQGELGFVRRELPCFGLPPSLAGARVA